MSLDTEIAQLAQAKSWFIEKYLADLHHPLKESVLKLVLVSDFASRHIDLLRDLLSTDACQTLLSREDYFTAIKQLNTESSLIQYQRSLRRFRHQHFLRLLLLQLSNLASTEEVMRSWSDCADALILQALEYIKHALSPRYGLPRDSNGDEVALLTIGMGKLGGRELNFSSDIDLIFAYTQPGMTDGPESCANEQYFIKMVQQFIQLLHHVTADGFVFRVDLRLRPNGDSGPLISSLDAMETYYQEQGRDWERYAMVKARVISDSLLEPQPWFSRLIEPFVYRRYVDFSVIESLRSMKAMIEREVQLNPQLNDIKRGKGGIREVEFIIQNVQLIRGGRLPQLQQQNALLALAQLIKAKLLPRSSGLKQAYLFLRHLENTLQSLNDQQTHSLPTEPNKQLQVSLAMGFPTWTELLDHLQKHQRIISQAFDSVLGTVEIYEDEKRLLTHQLTSLWQGHVEPSMAINLLVSLGYEQAEHCYQMVHTFKHSPRCRRLSQSARMRLDRFMVLLFSELQHCSKTDEILMQVIHLLENIVGRSAYLALLTENPQALRELLFWFANSPFITSLLVNQPFLLEVLLEQDRNMQPLSKRVLQHRLQQQLSHTEDIEVQEEIMRQFKLTHWLIAARLELYGICDAVRIGKLLTDIAEVIVKQVFDNACRQLCLRQSEMKQVGSHFAIIAYGKLGSREMNYSSDLDLVFLHNLPVTEETLATRLSQKILHMLTTRSQAGILYPVDTRLRPSGSAGLLVSHIDAFVEYQCTQAWTWEHQALLKARIIAGNPRIKRGFQQVKRTVMAVERIAPKLQDDVLSMRSKIIQQKDSDPVKHRPGGLLDLEFLVQFLVLKSQNPELAKYSNTLSQLQQLLLVKVITEPQFKILKKAYQQYHRLLHQRVLKAQTELNEKTFEEVRDLCTQLYSNAASNSSSE